ncbi:MAG: efflux RND transporter periplasmic adaptor subunit [Campylobacterales bacterium]
MKKVLLWAAAIGTLWANDPARVVQKFNVKMTEVQAIDYAPTRRFYAVVTPDEARVAEVSLRFDGWVKTLHAAQSYAAVEKGQPLLSVYSPEATAALEELIKSGHSEAMRDSSRRRLRLLGVDEAEIKAAEKNGRATEEIAVRSPLSGFVLEKKFNPGAFAPAGSTLVSVADLSTVWIEARVWPHDLPFVSQAKKAEVFSPGMAGTKSATPLLIAPSTGADQTVIARYAVQNPDGALKPGNFAEVALSLPPRKILALPASAVMPRGEQFYVFKKSDFEGEYDPIEIEATRLDSRLYEVVSGLDEGDQVVSGALFLFDSDAEINMLY